MGAGMLLGVAETAAEGVPGLLEKLFGSSGICSAKRWRGAYGDWRCDSQERNEATADGISTWCNVYAVAGAAERTRDDQR